MGSRAKMGTKEGGIKLEVLLGWNGTEWNEGRGVFAELDAGFGSLSEVRSH